MKRLSVAVLLWLSAWAVHGQTLQQAQQQGLVKVSAWLEVDGPVALAEQVRMTIELATTTWFTQGTRLGDLQVAGAVVLQQQKLATNYVERRADGQSWTIQRWELTLYPQRSGTLTVPPLAVTLGIAGEAGAKLSGTLLTEPLRVAVQWPSPLLSQDSQWLVASDYQASMQYSQPPEQALRVGDALTVTIEQTATDSAAMLLPVPVFAKPVHAQHYVAPPQLNDAAIRGAYSAERSDSATYIVQEGGTLSLPEQTFYWWQPSTQTLHTVVLPAQQWAVKHTWRSGLRAYGPWGLLAFVCLLALAKAVLMIRQRWQAGRVPMPLLFWQALRLRDWPQAHRLLYLRAYQRTGSVTLKDALPAQQQAQQQAWSREHFAAPVAPQAGSTRRLWRALTVKRIKRRLWPAALPELNKD